MINILIFGLIFTGILLVNSAIKPTEDKRNIKKEVIEFMKGYIDENS